MTLISVIICSHNPRRDYLSRVLQALQAQSLPADQWELIVVDNASTEELAGRFLINWHPDARHVREEDLGLTPARLRGIAEAQGDILVFVDDDNVLNNDYLEKTLVIGEAYPFLGSWGGTILPEFEEVPRAWTRPHWGNLAVRDIRVPMWTNVPQFWQAQPIGAGLCVRSTVARLYREEVLSDALRRILDRKGASLLSGGDTDLALTAEKLELGWGVFPQLVLTHLIPRERLTESYLLQLNEGLAASNTALMLKRDQMIPPQRPWRQGLGWLKTLVLHGRRAAKFYWSSVRGARRGIELVRTAHDAHMTPDPR